MVRPSFHIVGAGRGGTSLLAALLDSHPSIDVGFERYAQELLMTSEMPRGVSDAVRYRVDMYLDACSKDASISFENGRLWGNKITTEQIHAAISVPGSCGDTDQHLGIFFNELLADQLIVFILRDGRSCVASKMKRAGLSLEAACERWIFSVRCWDFLRRRSMPTAILRFEDILVQPVKALEEVCAHLGVAYQASMLSGTSSERLLPEYRQEGFDLTRLQEISVSPPGYALLQPDLLRTGYLRNLG